MKVLLFDIDGTLLTAKGAGQHAACLAMQSAFGAEPHANGIAFAGRTDRAITNDLFELHRVKNDSQNWTQFQNHYLTHLAESLRRKDGTLLPGIRQILAFVEKLPNILLGLLTGNIEKAAALKLNHFRVAHYFSFGGFGDQHQDRNRVAQQAFENAVKQATQPIQSDAVWVIGDTPNDVRCGKSIRAKTLAVATGSYSRNELEESQPDITMDDLSDFETAIEVLLQ